MPQARILNYFLTCLCVKLLTIGTAFPQAMPLIRITSAPNLEFDFTALGEPLAPATFEYSAFLYRNNPDNSSPLYRTQSISNFEQDLSIATLESMASSKSEIEPGLTPQLPVASRTVQNPDANWLSVKLAANIGNGVVTLTGNNTEQTQILNQQDIDILNGQSALFDGQSLTIRVYGAPEDPDTSDYSLTVSEVQAGISPRLDKMDLSARPESRCGPDDDRRPYVHGPDARVMPVGCTAFLISTNTFLTAGHCMGPEMTEVQFNVPMSTPDGLPVGSASRDRYMIIPDSVIGTSGEIGDDWSLFKTMPNKVTGLMPAVQQESHYILFEKSRSNELAISGYGVDDIQRGSSHLTHFYNNFSQTLQVDTGEYLSAPGENPILHRIDTRGANSGSAIRDGNRTNHAFGIHTNGGCDVLANKGTSLSHPPLKGAIQAEGIIVHPIQPIN